MGEVITIPTELRIRLNDWMTNALSQLSERTGMDYNNLTRMALMEYLERRLRPKDWETINTFEYFSIKDTIFEIEHYNRLLRKWPEKRVENFKKLFIVALQNYKKLKHTYFKEYKTKISRFEKAIWSEPGVIDLLDFFTMLNKVPLNDPDPDEHLLNNGKENEYYAKKWDEVYANIKQMLGLKTHKNYTHIIEMKIDNHIQTDTDMMYYLYDLLKNKRALPPSSNHETKTIPDTSGVDEGSLEELIQKYGIDYSFIQTEELETIRKNYGNLAHIDYMIKYFQDVIKAEKNYMDKQWVETSKQELVKWQQLKEDFMKSYKIKRDKTKHEKK